MRVDDQISDAHVALGTAYVAKGRLEHAVETLQRGIALDPSRPQAHQLAQVYRKQGRSEEAQKELELFQKLDAATREKMHREAENFLQTKPN